MRNALIATAVVVTTVLGASATSRAVEQGEPAPQATEQAVPLLASPDFGSNNGPEQRLPRGRKMAGPEMLHQDMMGPDLLGPDLLGLATKLSAAEIYLGVTPEQLGPWRAYATALIDLVLPTSERKPLPPKGSGAAGLEPRLAGEELAGLIMNKAEQAKALQDAAATLKPKLSPQQVQKLAELERVLMPPPPPGPHHGRARDGRVEPPHGDGMPPLPQAERG
ncbi:hypothetical protein SAMN05216358_0887 [Rhizobium sp. AN5]|uniref:hypothetical protein n=1 Tax=Rhizobium sp. AN5 TaxID=1855304 RepID=UPI000BC3FCD9|nr:hypothetical protein [Rhizobium sp. AN5]SOC90789.1 hypothetical protein SAMN05216358_0887 [Rhizobium sp. AN5]